MENADLPISSSFRNALNVLGQDFSSRACFEKNSTVYSIWAIAIDPLANSNLPAAKILQTSTEKLCGGMGGRRSEASCRQSRSMRPFAIIAIDIIRLMDSVYIGLLSSVILLRLYSLWR